MKRNIGPRLTTKIKGMTHSVLSVETDEGYPFSVPVEFVGVSGAGDLKVVCHFKQLPSPGSRVRACLLFHEVDMVRGTYGVVMFKGTALIPEDHRGTIAFEAKKSFTIPSIRTLRTLAIGLGTFFRGRKNMGRFQAPPPDLKRLVREWKGA